MIVFKKKINGYFNQINEHRNSGRTVKEILTITDHISVFLAVFRFYFSFQSKGCVSKRELGSFKWIFMTLHTKARHEFIIRVYVDL